MSSLDLTSNRKNHTYVDLVGIYQLKHPNSSHTFTRQQLTLSENEFSHLSLNICNIALLN